MAPGVALLALFLALLGPPSIAQAVPRVVNGTITADYPSVGALIFYTDAQKTAIDSMCSGTLVGCRAFLTAAHCVCPDNAGDAAGCEAVGLIDPATMEVFLQQGGIYAADGVAIDPDYVFAAGGDLAVVHLRDPVTGIAPSPLNAAARPPFGTVGTVVGFGTTGGRGAVDFGVKRSGKVTTSSCGTETPDATQLCWTFTGAGSNICSGDSGGPLFTDMGSGLVVAGVTSGHSRGSCLAGDQSFDTDVFVHRAWIMSQLDVGDMSCGNLPLAGGRQVQVVPAAAVLDPSTGELQVALSVPAGTRLLRVGLDGQIASGSGPSTVDNDFDLFVKLGAPPSPQDFDCADDNATPFGFCEIADPVPGDWHFLAIRVAGEGEVQLTASAFGANRDDINCDGRLGAADLVAEIERIGSGEASSCGGGDANGDGVIGATDIPPVVATLFAF